ncbi:hypothetical protein CN563_13430 [Bacillus sp. AFS026049]|nr:hypothetical protein CN563_13430 [Bacillus sp. AFS026049]
MVLSDWLATLQVSDVVMESTGVYWKPIWNILEGPFHLVCVGPENYESAGKKSKTTQGNKELKTMAI